MLYRSIVRLSMTAALGVALVAFSGCPINLPTTTFEIWLINGSSLTVDKLTISDSNPNKAQLEVLKGATVPPNGFKIIRNVSNALFEVGQVSTVWYTVDTTSDDDASVGPTQGGIPTGSVIPLLVEGTSGANLSVKLLSFQDNVKVFSTFEGN
ncbi:MAG: hypothetical protein AMXMBFR84_31840 [Candidatus Hydrogenedentota bacterium]